MTHLLSRLLANARMLWFRHRGPAAGGSIAKPVVRRRRTGRTWAIDVRGRRVVGWRWTARLRVPSFSRFFPSTMDIAFSAGPCACPGGASASPSAGIVIEDEFEFVDGRHGRVRRMRHCRKRQCDATRDEDGGPPESRHCRVLHAEIVRATDDKAFDVTTLVNERLPSFSGAGMGMPELLAVFAASAPASIRADLTAVADVDAEMNVVLSDLRELRFVLGDAIRW
jgi:hypothetical protein